MKKGITLTALVALALGLAANLAAGFPFWANSASRKNPNDPKTSTFNPTNTPTPATRVVTVAGSLTSGFSGDGLSASLAQFKSLDDISISQTDDVYLCDEGNRRIRKLDHSSNIVTTIAGNGTLAISPDGSAANSPIELNAIALDHNGDVVFSDYTMIRRISGGVLNTIAGTNGIYGYSGDGGPATAAKIYAYPGAIALRSNGDLLFVDDKRIRRIAYDSLSITTVAGNGTTLMPVSGINALNAGFNNIMQICFDRNGKLLVVDSDNNCVHRIDLDSGILTVVAGVGVRSFLGDGGAATTCELNQPWGVAVDASNNIFIADLGNNRIRKISASSGIISTIAGSGASPNSTNDKENRDALTTPINPYYMQFNSEGNLLFTEYSRVRKLIFNH